MSNDVLGAFARQIDTLLSRRRTVRGIGVGTLAAVAAGLDDALAGSSKKKKRRKRKKRKEKRQKSSPPTCSELCSEAFEVCFARAVDSTLCGETFGTECRGCFTDQDCLGLDEAYCLQVDGLTARETGEPLTVLRSICGPFLDSVCARIIN
jgi:hypothetical protein